MKHNLSLSWSTYASMSLVLGLGFGFGVACDWSANPSFPNPGAIEPESSRPEVGSVGTDRADQDDPARAGKRIDRRALLIGVTKYDHLRPEYHLQGPANDVQLMRRLLRESYGFSTDGIVCLAEDEAVPARRPTRANIEREFLRLADQANEGDQVVILLSGHGARQPEAIPPDPVYPEPDGIDEIFLPADVREWKGFPERVPSALIDNEIGVWLRAIAAKRAFVWVIFDCCHSGTMTRGAEVVRELPPGMLVPREELDQARERTSRRQAATGGRPSVKLAPFVPAQPSDYLVAFFACRPEEQTPESPQPPVAEDAKYYGLLTYTLVDILTKSATSKAPLTYREVVQRLQVRYAGRPQGSPTPLIEGQGQDRVVLGTEQPRRADLLLTRDNDGYKVNAGDLYGLTPGSVLAVTSPPGGEQEPNLLGYVRVSATRPFDATVQPCGYRGSPVASDLPPLSSCRTVFIDYGLRRLKVAIQASDGQEASRQTLQKALQPIADAKTGLVELVNDPRKADWLLRSDQNGVELFEASGNRPPFPLPPPRTLLFGSSLRQDLEKVFRARNLVALASRFEAERYRGSSEVDVEVEVLLQKNRQSTSGVAPAPAGGWVFRPGNLISFRIRNQSQSTRVDVTLLIVGIDLRIHNFYPRANDVGKSLIPGETLTIPTPPDAPGEINEKPPFGPESLVVIAVPAKNPPFDFAALAQSGLPLTRAEDVNQAPRSPLRELLESAMFGTGTRNGLEQSVADQYGLRILTWRTEPK